MQQITDQSLSTLWNRCRVVGFINMIYFGINIITTVLALASCIFLLFQTKTKAEEEKYSNNYIILIIICAIITLIILIVFYRINYGLTSGNPPSNGTKTERWLVFHKVLFFVYIICSICMTILQLEFIFGGAFLLISIMCALWCIHHFGFDDNFFRFSIIEMEDKTGLLENNI